ncbi:uncharacterized protein LOC113492325 isoform X2 [Trichoplusia ni]|uniref:Uncharacterized protein LOC113492325 isoform X2 n=1 Tax=Trichoplusia ni TaxID=7111 RepID=A0A7E5VBC8_TRINI|nr:uncharacterized protein LOC113492325 isoform X2 [Trichoplusia ni]
MKINMESLKSVRLTVIIFLICLCVESKAKLNENKTTDHSAEVKSPKKMNEGAALIFADEFKQTLDRYLFGICPQSFKSRWLQMSLKGKNGTAVACDLDADQQDLAGRLATLALRAHTAARSDCGRLGAALANTLGDLARTAANRQILAAASNEQKKRKLSKSQKMKIQAKQRTALAVKKKAAAAAAAAAAKMAS